VANPDYATLLPLIAAETDPVIKQQLIDQCYQFLFPLTDAERELFEYCNFDYVEDTPGYVNANASLPYVEVNYVANGYITSTELAEAQPYVLENYVVNGYINIENDGIGITNESGWSAYVGVYYNDNGETT